ncbi:MAG: ATP-binding protein [Bacillus sp. (in: Bacteria)]|nr:ATP-binding protein [Bacillus sp. (in: firmicutes)]
MMKSLANNSYITILWMVIFSNLLVTNPLMSHLLILVEAGLLLKIFFLLRDTNKQKEISENLFLLESKLQTMAEEKDVPQSILKEMQRMTGTDFIVYRSTTLASYGISGIGSLHDNKNYGDHGDILNYTIKWGSPIFVKDFKDITTLPFETTDISLVSNENLVSIYSVPLVYNQKVLGGILFGTRFQYKLTENRKNMFRSITTMLSIYLENKNLYRRMEDHATVCERQRISREIHDGLAQNIGFLNIQLHQLGKMISTNEKEKAMYEIEIAKEVVKETYNELRVAINQLRDNNGYLHSLEEWVREYTNHFQKMNGIRVEVNFCQIAKIDLSEEVTVQMTRVVQEIFNNIRKHAQAKNVWLKCQQKEHYFKFTIKDDGVGFDPTINHKQKYHGMGLMILKERIENIQGDIKISSTLYNGTIIEIEVPMAS